MGDDNGYVIKLLNRIYELKNLLIFLNVLLIMIIYC